MGSAIVVSLVGKNRIDALKATCKIRRHANTGDIAGIGDNDAKGICANRQREQKSGKKKFH
jgi:hypothetical protein